MEIFLCKLHILKVLWKMVLLLSFMTLKLSANFNRSAIPHFQVWEIWAFTSLWRITRVTLLIPPGSCQPTTRSQRWTRKVTQTTTTTMQIVKRKHFRSGNFWKSSVRPTAHRTTTLVTSETGIVTPMTSSIAIRYQSLYLNLFIHTFFLIREKSQLFEEIVQPAL